MVRVPITKEGYERLKDELQRLKREERPMVIRAIEEARAHGDISENAEYEAAKDKQAMIEGKINDLLQKLGSSEVIERSENDNGRIVFGSTVKMEDLETGEIAAYRLVGPYEADVQTGTISVTSPLGKALIGKEEGEEVKVQTPKGVRNFEILQVA
ncbi:transcription elongation factor GreA [Desulfoferrobacter suflitae]|uniref:transcription elongation factor GreA n=1 Tax=Desulfoferrobacter suflitae TaxID=2865782 RepID=UPI0021642CDE|nr:transcription elongation factor GreA [Desulfoferrobacter suflitae]MCK8602278.1 transcription elongation factor GreA [Desulfoferrobacter suflitae]